MASAKLKQLDNWARQKWDRLDTKAVGARKDWMDPITERRVLQADTPEKQDLAVQHLSSMMGREGAVLKHLGSGKTKKGYGQVKVGAKPLTEAQEGDLLKLVQLANKSTVDAGFLKDPTNQNRVQAPIQKEAIQALKRSYITPSRDHVGRGPIAAFAQTMAGTDPFDRTVQGTVYTGGILAAGNALSALTQKVQAINEYMQEGERTEQSRLT